MPYSIPAMPLLCSIWTGPFDPGDDPREVDVPCNLAWGKRTLANFQPESPSDPGFGTCAQLLLLAGTDIRGYAQSPFGDAVEVPQGSGRMYLVRQVDDFGKGFDNEHRFAMIFPFGFWPVPYP